MVRSASANGAAKSIAVAAPAPIKSTPATPTRTSAGNDKENAPPQVPNSSPPPPPTQPPAPAPALIRRAGGSLLAPKLGGLKPFAVQKPVAGSGAPTAAVAKSGGGGDETSTEYYFSVLYCQRSNKKHKSYLVSFGGR